jgi:tRNA pseudouridine38-40 synthase
VMSAREGAPRRFRARVEYDGTDFAGFQVQPGKRTVQVELEAALARLEPGGSGRVDGAGRTDAGVHASGQVIAFTYPGRLSGSRLERSLEALLPADIAISDLHRVPAEFHPRYAARYREYRYTVWNGPHRPLLEAGLVLVGRHDFSAFGAPDRQPVRTVHAVRVRRRGRVVTIDVRADAFLRGMVRRIVAVLLKVGHGKMDVAGVAAALDAGRPALSGAAAPARGLCLRRVALGRAARERPGAELDGELGAS